MRRHDSEDLWTPPLAAIPLLLRGMGADATAVFREAGIDPAALADPAQRLPCESVAALVDDCVRATGCPQFGLLTGQRAGIAAIGVIADLVRSVATVGEGLEVLSTHIRLADRGLVIVLRTLGTTRAELSLALCAPAMRGAAPYLDGSVAITLAVMRSLCGPRWVPSLVTFARAAPPSVRPYQACFAAPVRFGQSRTALIFPASVLDRKLGPDDRAARRELQRRVSDLESRLPSTATESVNRVLRTLIMTQSPTRTEVAGAVGLSCRTLSRRLHGEGSNFRDLLTEVRCGLAAQMLEDSDMPVARIATALHFSAPGAFTRAFKAWCGATPMQRRSARRLRRRRV